MITRPLLAGTLEDVSKLNYPVFATPKLDGIRVLKVDKKVLTRKFKELPNTFIRERLQFILKDGMDGEVMLRSGTFNEIQSAVMSFDGEPDYIFHVFDYVKDTLDKPYIERLKDLEEWWNQTYLKFVGLQKAGVTIVEPENFRDKIRPLFPKQINNEQDLLQYEKECLEQGYEGIMIRRGDGKYKCGRATLKEGILLKLKRFKDAEAVVIGFEEKLHNDNIQEVDEFGLSKRSHKKDGLVPAGTLGSLIVEDLTSKIKFGIGSGFDDATKLDIWNNRDKYLGKLVKYKYQEVGVKEAPRFPVFLGFRSELDL